MKYDKNDYVALAQLASDRIKDELAMYGIGEEDARRLTIIPVATVRTIVNLVSELDDVPPIKEELPLPKGGPMPEIVVIGEKPRRRTYRVYVDEVNMDELAKSLYDLSGKTGWMPTRAMWNVMHGPTLPGSQTILRKTGLSWTELAHRVGLKPTLPRRRWQRD